MSRIFMFSTLDVEFSFQYKKVEYDLWYRSTEDTVDLAFDSTVLREAARKEKKAIAMFGMDVAPMFMSRIADLRASPTAADLPQAIFELSVELPIVKAKLLSSISLIAFAVPGSYSIYGNGTVDWTSVDRLKLSVIQGQDS